MIAIITTLFCGIILGLILAIASLGIIKTNCPKCKQLRPILQIILFRWKALVITGKLCWKCQNRPEQVEIEL